MEETFRVDSAWTRLLAALGVAALAFALLPLASASAQESGHPSGDADGEATTASEHTPIEQRRLSGATRFQTAADIATSGFDSADTVVIASGEKFPDALAGASLEGNLGAPVLLTPENLIQGSIPSEITDAIDELGATDAVFLGGESDAVSDEVESYIVANSSVEDTDRVSGATRYETAAAIAAQVRANNPTAGQASEELAAGLEVETGTAVAFVATGEEFPDALAAGPGSYDGEHPVFLTPQDRLHGAADDGLEDFGADVIFLLGGTAAIDESVENELDDQGYDVRRVGGANRFETATMLADLFIEDFGFDVDDVGLATGDPFADALASAPYLGSLNAPLVLTPFNTTEPHTEDFFERHGCNIDVIHTFGGTAAVEEAVVDAYASIACPDALALSIAPESQTVGETATATATLTDEDGDPVEGETVEFTTDHSEDAAVVPPDGDEDTDADGEAEFEFTTAETGTVTVTAEVNGLTAEADVVFNVGDAVTDEAVDNLQENVPGQNQAFTFTVADGPIEAGDTVTIDVSDADDRNADYTGASVDAVTGEGEAVFDPATNTITYTGGATEDAVGDTITINLADVDAGAAETGLEAIFAREGHENTVTFDIE